MSENLNQKETATFEELLMSNIYTQEGLINLLEKKGVINKKDFLEVINKLKKQQTLYRKSTLSSSYICNIQTSLICYIWKSVI